MRMSITLTQVYGLNKDNLAQAVSKAQAKKAHYEAQKQYSTAEKYGEMATRLAAAQKKLSGINAKLAEPIPGSSPAQTYLDKYFAGATDTSKFTLSYISSKIAVDGLTLDSLDSSVKDEAIDVSKIHVRRNIFDVAKDFAKDTSNGKNRAPKLTNFIMGYGIAEVLTTFVTGGLAKAGVMAESTTLLGLAKTGITQLIPKLPAVWQTVSSVLASNPVGFAAAGAAVAMMAIPIVAKKTKDICNKVKKHYGVQVEVDKPMLEQIAKNKTEGFAL